MAAPESADPPAGQAATLLVQAPEFDPFLDQFRSRFGDNLLLVILFGSCLSPETRSPTSFPDFFLVVEDYGRTPGSWLARLGHRILAPDLYHLGRPGPDGKILDCKYYLISREDLWRATGPEARDLYVLGRLSKRVAIIYARDRGSENLAGRVLARAGEQAARLAAALLEGPAAEDDFYREVLRLSYRAERRLEDERKIESLFRSGESFYRRVYGGRVERLLEENILMRRPDQALVRNPAGPGLRPDQVQRFLERSRRRAQMRWPKMMLTVDNWVDQLLQKLERTYQIKLDIPPWERKIVLITGWRHYFRLKRQGKIR